MTTIDIIGAWTPRPQSLDDVTTATAKMLHDMPALPGLWVTTPGDSSGDDGDPQRFTALDLNAHADLAARILAATAEVKNMKNPGQYATIRRRTEQGKFPLSLRIRAGFAKPRNRIIASLRLDEVTSAASQRLIRAVMAAVIGAWNPDWLKAGTYEVQKQQGHSHGPVIIGWDTYISDRIDFDDTAIDGRLATVHGAAGRYVTLDGTPAEPSLEQAQLVRAALGY
ncbi:hypothetical protein AAFP35_16925 [Gordonia sp. CPCC 206044]|uniref:hypothetical protein n=1 Tax=Gordonia sp. CPCC 206044 TaxID=3140793 RepID=UPI003AF38FEA